MSGWDAFIAALQQVGIQYGCIVSRENGAIWGITPGFSLDNYVLSIPDETETSTVQVTIQELPRLLHMAANEGNSPDSYGIYLGQKKYYRVSFDPEKRSIYLKSKDGFACLAYTDKALVLGAWVGLPPAVPNERVEYLAGEIAKAGF